MSLSRTFQKILIALSIAFFVGYVHGQRDLSITEIPSRTIILCRMDSEISSKFSSAGDTFTATVSNPLFIGEKLMLAAGSKIEWRIRKVRRAGLGNRAGILEISFDKLMLPNGVRRELDASLTKPRESRSATRRNIFSILGLTAIGAIAGKATQINHGVYKGSGIGASIGLVSVLLSDGREERFEADSEFEITLNKPLRIPVEDF